MKNKKLALMGCFIFAGYAKKEGPLRSVVVAPSATMKNETGKTSL